MPRPPNNNRQSNVNNNNANNNNNNNVNNNNVNNNANNNANNNPNHNNQNNNNNWRNIPFVEFPNEDTCVHDNCCNYRMKNVDDNNKTKVSLQSITVDSFTHFPGRGLLQYSRLYQYGRPRAAWHKGTTYVNIVEQIFTNNIFYSYIDATNAHGANDPYWVAIPRSEEGVVIMKGFLAIIIGARLYRVPFRDLWSTKPFVGLPTLAKTMTRTRFLSIQKHFRVVNPNGLPDRDSPDYHPYQNINAGLQLLKNNSIALWNAGMFLCIDESRVVSKAWGDLFKTHNNDKPIRSGKDVWTISDCGMWADGFVIDSIPYCGPHTYDDPNEKRMFNVCKQLLRRYRDTYRVVIVDNKFMSLDLLKKAREDWHLGIVGTATGKTGHLPRFSKKKGFKKFVSDQNRGSYKQYVVDTHHTYTVWNDSNPCYFLDNCLNQQHWGEIERHAAPDNENKDDESSDDSDTEYKRQSFDAPLVSLVYNKYKHLVDCSNQLRAAAPIDYKTQRKQNRLLFAEIERYVFNNAYILFKNSQQLWEDQYTSHTDIKFRHLRCELINAWATPCKYLFQRENSQVYVRSKKIAKMYIQPTHGHTQILMTGSKRKCIECGKTTKYTCAACRIYDNNEIPLCNERTTLDNRTCFADWHDDIDRNFDSDDDEDDD